MTINTISPIAVSNVPTAMTDIPGIEPATGYERNLVIRATNKTTADILYRLYLTTSADTSQSAGVYRAYDFAIPAGDPRNVETRGELLIPHGFKLQHRASATGLDVSVTGTEKAS